MTSQHRAEGRGIRVLFVFSIRGDMLECGGGAVIQCARRRGARPELSENRGAQENTGPPKQNTSMEMDIFTCMAPKTTAAERLFNGKQGDCVRPARGSP